MWCVYINSERREVIICPRGIINFLVACWCICCDTQFLCSGMKDCSEFQPLICSKLLLSSELCHFSTHHVCDSWSKNKPQVSGSIFSDSMPKPQWLQRDLHKRSVNLSKTFHEPHPQEDSYPGVFCEPLRCPEIIWPGALQGRVKGTPCLAIFLSNVQQIWYFLIYHTPNADDSFSLRRFYSFTNNGVKCNCFLILLNLIQGKYISNNVIEYVQYSRNHGISRAGSDSQGSCSPTPGPAQDVPKIPQCAWECCPSPSGALAALVVWPLIFPNFS